MNLPEWVLNSGWGILLIIFTILLPQAKVLTDLWIRKSDQRRIDFYLEEITKASAIIKELGPDAEASMHLTRFVNHSSRNIVSINNHRFALQRRKMIAKQEGYNTSLALGYLLLARHVFWIVTLAVFSFMCLIAMLAIGDLTFTREDAPLHPESPLGWVITGVLLFLILTSLMAALVYGIYALENLKDDLRDLLSSKSNRKNSHS